MTLGSFFLIESPAPYLQISLAVIIPTVAATALFFFFIIGLAVKVHRKKRVSGPEAMVGEEGLAETDIDPMGSVFLHSEIWKARSESRIDKGDEVKVIAIDGLTLHVKRK